MDYLEIVLHGFRYNHEYLDKYFVRQFKEAESKNYVFGEFFKGCLNIVAALDKNLKELYYTDKKEFQECLKYAISTNDNDAENHFREQLKELNELKECNYSVNLYQFTNGKFTGDLDYEDIKYITLSIGLAIQKLQEQTPATSSETEPPGTGDNNSINDLPEIFAETGFQTFKMLEEKYKKDNKKLKAKYSNLFWFLESEDLLKCTQLEYIDFIKQNYSIKLSKILPQTAKYEDVIQPLLKRYFKGQQ